MRRMSCVLLLGLAVTIGSGCGLAPSSREAAPPSVRKGSAPRVAPKAELPEAAAKRVKELYPDAAMGRTTSGVEDRKSVV